MIFDEIFGHNKITGYLLDAVKADKVSHAYVFCGKKGVGKFTVANAFASLLTDGSQADITCVTNDNYSIKEKTQLSVEAVRLARTDIYTKPYLADRRVFLFPNAETMTVAAQNALLKVLEEPPSYCTIILITQNENALLPTILSRAVSIRFSPLSKNDIEKYLINNGQTPDTLAIRLSGGSIGAMKELLEREENIKIAHEIASLFKRFCMLDEAVVYETVAFFDKEKASCSLLLNVFEIMLEDSLLNRNRNYDIIAFDINSGAAIKIIEYIQKARRAIQSNRNYNMVVTELLLEAWRTIHD